MSTHTLDDLCAACSLPLVAELQAMCFDCEALTCEHTCGYDTSPEPQPVEREAPPCEDWQCKHRTKCERAFEEGIAAQKTCAGCEWEHAEMCDADACNDCIRKLALPDNYVPTEERSAP